jgi:hypothetical protein
VPISQGAQATAVLDLRLCDLDERSCPAPTAIGRAVPQCQIDPGLPHPMLRCRRWPPRSRAAGCGPLHAMWPPATSHDRWLQVGVPTQASADTASIRSTRSARSSTAAPSDLACSITTHTKRQRGRLHKRYRQNQLSRVCQYTARAVCSRPGEPAKMSPGRGSKRLNKHAVRAGQARPGPERSRCRKRNRERRAGVAGGWSSTALLRRLWT